jgi:hypothetical protein
MIPVPRELRLWGVLGAAVAALFAVWMLFFPNLVPLFAWNVQPRLAQVFIGVGYIFRTVFFLLFVFEKDWRKLRWTFWGNMLFTGTLLLATLWHADQMRWLSVVAHVWVVFYTYEPLSMIFFSPRDEAARTAHTTTGGPIWRGSRLLLLLEVGVLAQMGLFLIVNPEWLNHRWPWALNPFDARIIAAWFLGWAGWATAIAFAADWDEVRTAMRLQILFSVSVLVSTLFFWGMYDWTRGTTRSTLIGLILIVLGSFLIYWQQERRRPRPTGEGTQTAQAPLTGQDTAP